MAASPERARIPAGPVSVAEPPDPAPRAPARAFGVGAVLASAGLIASFGALGLNSIAVARIEGPDGAGLIALCTQVVVIAAFIAGIGMRTSVTYRVGAGLWSARSAVRGALGASLALGLAGAALGFGVYLLLRHSAMSEFSPLMAASLMGTLPLALAWWIVPAIPLACERFEQYALLTVAAPVAVLLSCPAGAMVGGKTGAVIGFAAGFALGGAANAAWALRFARTEEAGQGPEHGIREAGGFGFRAWVNDLFQFINVRPDLFILSAYWGAADTGVYAVTISITSLVWILSQPLASVVLPRTASLEALGTGRAAWHSDRAPGLGCAPRCPRLRADGAGGDTDPCDRAARLGRGLWSDSRVGLDRGPRGSAARGGTGDGGRFHGPRRGESRAAGGGGQLPADRGRLPPRDSRPWRHRRRDRLLRLLRAGLAAGCRALFPNHRGRGPRFVAARAPGSGRLRSAQPPDQGGAARPYRAAIASTAVPEPTTGQRGEGIALAILAVAMAAAVVVLLYWGRDQVMVGDDLFYAQRLAENPLWHAILHSNLYLLALPMALYKAMFELFGIGSYLPYRLVAIALALVCVGLFYALARRRIGGLYALAPTILILFFGSGGRSCSPARGFPRCSQSPRGWGRSWRSSARTAAVTCWGRSCSASRPPRIRPGLDFWSPALC